MRDIDASCDSLVAVLRMRAELHPELTAIDFLGDGEEISASTTYAGLDRTARSIATALQQRCVPGERALLLLPSGLDYVAAFLGCLYAGVLAVPLHSPEPRQPGFERRLREIMKDAEPKVVFLDAASEAVLASYNIESQALTRVRVDRLEERADAWQPHNVSADDVAFLQYTSGSTASPKGVVVRHRHLVANQGSLSELIAERATDRYLSWLPLFHDMGLILGVLQPLFCGVPLVLLSPKRFLERPRRWLQALARYKATISAAPDFAYRLCVDRIRPESVRGLDLSAWRVAFSGAEPVRHSTVEAFLNFARPLGFDERALWPAYGLAEATLLVCASTRGVSGGRMFATNSLAEGSVAPAERGSAMVSCGMTPRSIEVCIVDPHTQTLLLEGRIGEIWIKGPAVAGGYWRNAAATEATFLARDANGDGPYLRTGDLAFIYEGAIYISGRLKDLIIVRGRNLYPQDIESEVERRVRAVRAGRVIAFALDTAAGESIGIAAEVAASRTPEECAAAIDAIRDAVAEAFGEPIAAVALLRPGGLPKTTSGKPQRSATRSRWLEGTLALASSWQASRAQPALQALRPGTQVRLAALWSELLDLPEIIATDNFFALGGQSLLMTQLAVRVAAEFAVALPIGAYFSSATLVEMAQRIDAAPRAQMHGIQRQSRAPQEQLPLSYAQRRLWFLQSLEPASSFYNVSLGITFSGAVSLPRLQTAIDAVIAKHEALRTIFEDGGAGPYQIVLPTSAVQLQIADAMDEDAATDCARLFSTHPFDLEHGPLLRVMWVSGAGATGHLILVLHHIAVDGASMAPLLRDLAAAYRGTELRAAEYAYTDFARWEQDDLAPRLPVLAQAWREMLRNAPALTTLPPNRPRPPAQSHRGATYKLELTAQLVAAVSRWAQRERATLFMAMFAAYAAALGHSAQQDDLVIGIDVANRLQPGTDQIVGFFVNQLPVRCRLAFGIPGRVALAEAKQALLSAYALQELPFDQLVETLRPPRSLAYAPVFQTKFVLQPAPTAESFGADLIGRPYLVDRDTAELDLLFDLAQQPDGIQVRIEYATDLYDAQSITEFSRRFVAILENWVTSPATMHPTALRRSLARRAARAMNAEDAS